MATVNKIATTRDCNAISNICFANMNMCTVGDTYTQTSVVNSSGAADICAIQTVRIRGEEKYFKIYEPCVLNVTVRHDMRFNSTTGTQLTGYNIVNQPILRVGVTSEFSSEVIPELEYYVDINLNLGSGSTVETTGTINIPIPFYGTWYVYAHFASAGRINNIQPSAFASGKTLYSTWEVSVCPHSLNWCPPYGTLYDMNFRINGDYEWEQCVKVEDILHPIGYIEFDVSGTDDSGNYGGLYRSDEQFHGYDYREWIEFIGGCDELIAEHQYDGTWEGKTFEGDEWESGFYYLDLYSTTGEYIVVCEMFLSNDEVERLNDGEILSKTLYATYTVPY